jgi:small neutral amino acid transporter SnatA (MarC family)
MKMMERKETIWNLLIIACAIILFAFLSGIFVSGIQDPGLAETVGIFVRTACLFLLISLGMKITQYYMKSLTPEMKEEEIREVEQKDEKQLLFKPTIRVTWWKTFRNLSDLGIIVSVLTLFVILLLLIFGLTVLGDKITMTFLCIAGLVLLISLGMDRVYQYYSEEIREAEEKDEKQLLFKPTTGSILFFLFLSFIGVSGFIHVVFLLEPNEDASYWIISSLFLIGLSLYLWYLQPVFSFTEDSVQIKSHLFYLLGIDRKTIIRYADITSVGPNQKIKANMWGVEPKHSIVISMNGTTQECGLGWFNSEIIAKIYLRFKEKLGDKVKLE